MIDCILVGHNDASFPDYVRALRRLGEDSATYRDLQLSYIEQHGVPLTFPDLYNRVRGADTRFGICSVLSPAVVYLGSYLARRGFAFDWVNGFQDSRESLARKLCTADVRTVAITTTYYMSPVPVIEIVEFVRQHNRRCKIVVGGPYIYSLFLSGGYQSPFKAMGADYYVVSQQGEKALARLLQVLRDGGDGVNIPNVAGRSGAGYSIDSVEIEVTDLDRDPVEWRWFDGRIGRVVSVRSAVSCPFSCSFCGFPARGGKYRTTTLTSLERELNALRDLGGIESVQYIDDTFNVPPTRFKELMRMMIRNKYRFRWNCQYRCQYADREAVELMKESGCEGVFLGIEAANDAVLANMNKGVTVEAYYRGLELLNSYEIPSHANFVIGFPGETEKSYRDIKTFLAQARPSFYRAQLWYCDPTTPIWNERERFGIRGRGFEWTHATMDADEAQSKVHDLFLGWDATTWTPQYNFEFYGVCQMMHEGIRLDDIHRAIRVFNHGVRQQLQGSSPSRAIEEDFKAALCGRAAQDA